MSALTTFTSPPPFSIPLAAFFHMALTSVGWPRRRKYIRAQSKHIKSHDVLQRSHQKTQKKRTGQRSNQGQSDNVA